MHSVARCAHGREYYYIDMKAAQVTRYGDSGVVEVVDLSVPSPKEGQALVEVYAASINPFDFKLRSGVFKDSIPLTMPYTAGADFSGVVTGVGSGVRELKEGDPVFGHAIILNGGSGSFAEYAACNVGNAAGKPEKTDFIEAASLPLVGASAIQALEEHMGLSSGQKILIHGGAGGIGSVAIQLAKHLGAHIATTVSGNDKEFAASLGADQIIDYKNEKFDELLKDFDAVYDTVGGKTTGRSFAVLKKGGVLVSMLGEPSEALAQERGVRALGQQTETSREHLTRLRALVDEGVIAPRVDTVYPLVQVREAFDRLETGSPRGKVVLKIKAGAP